jgi:beta-glucosidase
MPLRRTSDIRHGRYYDFIGINYYTRSTVRGIGDGVRSGVPVNDLGWEIYPQGLIECARRMHKKYDAPIFITENGTCDENDSFRCRYIFEHLNEISKSDLPIERYYHWCFCDNFEWLEGESARFGLVHVDYDTQTRTCKQSGFFFSKIIEQNGVDEQLYTEYADQSYREN